MHLEPGLRHRGTLESFSTRNSGSGFTLLEIIIVITILSILTAAAVPMVRNTVKREREMELRLALRQLRQAIDAYKKYYDETGGRAIPMEWQTTGRSGYPKNLEVLVEGFIPANVVAASGTRKKFLRRLPVDPITGSTEWGLRAYKDEPDSGSWGGEDVFDVYSLSDKEALNGTRYRDW